MSTPDRMIPEIKIDADSEQFWAGTVRGELRIQRCDACGRHQYYPRVHCTSCSSLELAWVTASGEGTVHSYTVCHFEISPLPVHAPPYVVALVDLDEGVRMLTNLVDVTDPGSVIGTRVRVDFVDRDEHVKLPVFRPIT